MQKLDFSQALDLIIAQDPRYARDAYHFLREALDFTIKLRKKAREASTHVTGQQLLDGVRLYALKEFGPMTSTVFSYWGIDRCEHFGDMVFNLIGIGIFGKTESDSIDDFKGVYDFQEAFVAPFLPGKPAAHRRLILESPAEELS